MPEPLWQTGDTDIDERIMRYLAGEDVLLDRHLLPYDIRATAAHVEGLRGIVILDEDECAALVAALEELAEEFASDRFELDARYEDGHSRAKSVTDNPVL